MGDSELPFSPKDLTVAYFSMEIGIDERLPTYSGGLGVLAGDTLRSCADLKVPVVGITLIYKKGYFKQRLDTEGNQQEEEVKWEPAAFLRLLPNKVSIMIERRRVWIQAWVHMVRGITGKSNPIILLDTDLPENAPTDREITHSLYGRDDYYRLAQEIVLGIGGTRMLESIGCTELKKYHMNEGHSALLALELCNHCEEKNVIDHVRKRCVFTTHTPVPAGHDQFPKALAEQLLGDFITPDVRKELFLNDRLNMTYLGLRFSEYINGVAKKHGQVSQSMFPGYHIESITNGVHSGFWVADPYKKLFDKYIPGWQSDPFNLRYVLGIPKEEIWTAHEVCKGKLVGYLKQRCNVEFDPNVFTIGFARRAATYKRGEMLLSDVERLLHIAEKCNGIQIVYSGKAHPRDWEGKQVIKRIMEKIGKIKDKIKICYVEDYDISVAKMLVSGVDLWLNTPLRPQEASGTSGMKAAHNGVLHFSVLDGWWLEGHIENVTGWSIGSHPDVLKEANHADEVEDLYMKLEYVILPRFYDERERWVDMMRHAIAINASFFNTHRMVQQYVLNAYFT
jgi:glycogen phosphorylase